jgi:acetyl-CoA C-acetyltransferase
MGTIKDKVAIIGMGCTKFGEIWDKGIPDLIIEAAYEAFEDAGIGPKDVQAAWIGNLHSGQMTGAFLTEALQLDMIPCTRVENNCASGAEAIRNAAFSVAAGMYDVALAVGVEKLKDYGSGMLEAPATYHPTLVAGSAPSAFARSAVRYFERYGLSREQGKRTIAKIAVKNHHNGTMHPKAMFQREVTIDAVMNAPFLSWPLGIFDCCPVSDGAAAAIVTRPELAKKFTKEWVNMKGSGLAVGRINPFQGKYRTAYEGTFWDETAAAAKQAYEQAGVKNPRKEISLAEVHDCFSITELIIYESLGFSPIGKGKEDVDSGFFTIKGELPVNPDGGLKSFGHPIGASGLRMIYEGYNQLLGRAGARQQKNPKLALAHSQGGTPGAFEAAVTIIGLPE